MARLAIALATSAGSAERRSVPVERQLFQRVCEGVLVVLRSPVHVAPVAKSNHDDKEHVVLDGVDDPVVTDSHPVASSTFERPRSGRPGVLSQ